MAHSHLSTTDAMALCGEPRAKRFSDTPTCKWCKKIQAGKRRPADPIETAGKMGRYVD